MPTTNRARRAHKGPIPSLIAADTGARADAIDQDAPGAPIGRTEAIAPQAADSTTPSGQAQIAFPGTETTASSVVPAEVHAELLSDEAVGGTVENPGEPPMEVPAALAPADDPGIATAAEESPLGTLAAPRLSLGRRLRAARESQNLMAADIAFQLKIGVRKIEALEDDRWDQLPEGPYLRGFLRNYAKILKIDAGELIDDINTRVETNSEPSDFSLLPSLRTPFPQRSRAQDSAVARFMRVGTLLFAVLAGLIAWSGTDSFRHSEEMMTSWLENRAKPEAAAPASTFETSVAPATGAGPAKSATELLVPPVSSGSGVSRSLSSPPSNPALTLAAISGSGSGASEDASTPQALSGDLVMRFNDDSWVEVRQADGKILMSQLNHAGAGKALDGAPPLELVIGNAPGVALQYRGNAVDLAPYTRDRVAHITLK